MSLYPANAPTLPLLGPDTDGVMWRLPDSLIVEVHRPRDEDGEWFAAGLTDLAVTMERQEIVRALFEEKVMWRHSVDVGSSPMRAPGAVFGWPSEASQTGYMSGVIVRVDHTHLRVLVRNIKPGNLVRPSRN